MKAKAKPAMKVMKAMSGIEHFERSDIADGAALHLRSKLDALRILGMKCVTGPLCQTLCHSMKFHIVMGMLGSIGAFDTLPSEVGITCILYGVLMCSGVLSGSAFRQEPNHTRGIHVTRPQAPPLLAVSHGSMLCWGF